MNITKHVSVLLVILLFQQCTHYYYAPNKVNMPLFREKGETKISIGTGGTDEVGMDEVQFAYSITDHIGIMANLAKGFDAYDYDWGGGYYHEGGIGYFSPMTRRSIFEVYGGFGDGNTKHHYNDSKIAHVEFDKYFLQPSFGFRWKYFEIAVGTRICALYFDHVKQHEELIPDEQKHIDYIRNNRLSYLVEPAIGFNLGFQRFKLTFQVVNSHNLTRPKLQMEEENINFGIQFYFKNCGK